MLGRLFDALLPFLWGGALALFLNVPLCAVERRLARLPLRRRRGAALIVVLAALVGALALGVWLLLPQLAVAVVQLTAAVPRLVGTVQLERTVQGAENALVSLMQAGMGAAVNAAAHLGNLLAALVLAVYLLADKEGLARRMFRLLQAIAGRQSAQQAAALGRRAVTVFSRFIAGQCIEAAILAGLFVLTLFVCRMPNVLPIAAVIGVTALVPVFGSFVCCSVGIALILPYSMQQAGWFVVLFLCLQQLENNLIYPRVVGSRVGLPPLWVLTAVILGGELFGVAGLVLGIPAMSVLYHLGKEWVNSRLEGANE